MCTPAPTPALLNLVGASRSSLAALFARAGAPAYRAQQVLQRAE